MRRALAIGPLAVGLVLGSACQDRGAAPPSPAPAMQVITATEAETAKPVRAAMSAEALTGGAFPDEAPEMNLLRSRCVICHGLDYVAQQRLTAAQWEKTVAKMRKWGAPVDDDQAKTLVSFLAHYWTPELPERRFPVSSAPRGALPEARPHGK